MEPNSVKKAVVESYGHLARQKKKTAFSGLFACCEETSYAREIGEIIGYSQEEMNNAPEESNLGVGCGNPSALAEMKEGDVVVDLGSGAGFDAFNVSPLVGESGRVIGIDLSDDMLALARENAYKYQYGNVEFVKGDIEALPLDSAMADHVISNCVINLSLQKAQVFQEAHRVLKKGGRLSISDIVLEKELPWIIKQSIPAHIACISGAEKLEDYLQYVLAAGFKDVKIVTKTAFPIELMLADPQVKKVAKAMRFVLSEEKIKELASRVVSVSLTARKA